ncbi:MAG: CpsD/CapB family tyrosine-protein kinase [Myxococcales bacterium]|nr:CpsD/CapB family tyrosine-protein kinase [Myxococcales bacterium]
MEHTLEKAQNFLSRAGEGAPSSNEVDRRLVTLTAPASAAAEQYRALYYRLERMRELAPMKLVAFTSALPSEGKSVTAANLALTSARANRERRVVLVDADFRRSRAANYLGIKPRPGLSELLAGDCEGREAVRRFRSSRLVVIPAGAPPEEPGQALAGPRMRQLLHSLREGFDEVYLDLPPALPFADASILAASVDGLVLVIRACATSHRFVAEAIERLSGTRLIGCVLNAAEPGGAFSEAYPR